MVGAEKTCEGSVDWCTLAQRTLKSEDLISTLTCAPTLPATVSLFIVAMLTAVVF